MPNQIVTSRMEGKGKRRRQWKRLIDVVEEVLKILGVRNWSVARDWKEWRRSVLGAKVHNRLDARGGRGGGGENKKKKKRRRKKRKGERRRRRSVSYIFLFHGGVFSRLLGLYKY